MVDTKEFYREMISAEYEDRLPYQETIPLLLEKCANDYADRIAVSDEKLTFSYTALYENVGKRIRLLNDKGIPEGGHVAVMCRNNADAMCWLLAIPSSGRVIVPLSCMLNAQALGGIVAKFDVDAFIAEDCFLPLTEGLSIPVFSASECGSEAAPFADISKDTTAAIYLTSGTTGASKGVVLSHGALTRGAKNGTYKPPEYVFGNKSVLMLPLSHIFGSVAGFLSALFTGTEIHGCNDVKSGIMLIPVVRPTILHLVPGIVEIILNLAKLKGAGFLGDLKSIVCGGSAVPPRLIKEAGQYGIRIFPGYGLTEAANLTTGNTDLDNRPASTGRIFPGQEVQVVDGELWLRGDNVMKEYYKDPEATAEVLTEDGWLRTGDLVSFDEEGYLTIIGRIKNLIILPNGENVSPEEIEDTFNRSELIQDCLVRESTANDRPVLSIEILPVASLLTGKSFEEVTEIIKEEVKKVNDTLPSFKQVSLITVRKEDFKRTGSLKVDRLHS